MSVNPKIARIFLPGNIGSISPPLLMFSAIISAPASPKPSANNAPVLIINFSRILVSYFNSSFLASMSTKSPFFKSSSKAIASYSSI